jgi:hypothetical protein
MKTKPTARQKEIALLELIIAHLDRQIMRVNRQREEMKQQLQYCCRILKKLKGGK